MYIYSNTSHINSVAFLIYHNLSEIEKFLFLMVCCTNNFIIHYVIIIFVLPGCHPSCKTCNGARISSCTSCPHYLFLSGSYCLSLCPRGTYAEEGLCIPCHESCSHCLGKGHKKYVVMLLVSCLDYRVNTLLNHDEKKRV